MAAAAGGVDAVGLGEGDAVGLLALVAGSAGAVGAVGVGGAVGGAEGVAAAVDDAVFVGFAVAGFGFEAPADLELFLAAGGGAGGVAGAGGGVGVVVEGALRAGGRGEEERGEEGREGGSRRVG